MRKKIQILLICLLGFTPFFTYTQNLVFDSLANEVNRLSRYKKTQSLEILDKMYQMTLNDPDSSLHIARCLYEESLLNYKQGIRDTLISGRIKKRLDRGGLQLQEHALLQLAYGNYQLSVDALSDAFSYHLQALEKYKKLKDKRFEARILNVLGNICYNIGLYNLSDYYYLEAGKNVTTDFYEYYQIKSNIFTNQLFIYNNSTIIDSALLLLKEAEEKGFLGSCYYMYANLGNYFFRTDLEKGLECFTKMLSLEFDSPCVEANLNANMGCYYAIKNEYFTALEYFRKAEKNIDIHDLPTLYSDFVSIFEKLNMTDSALFYSKKQMEVFQKLRSNTIAIETHQKYITTMLESSQKDLTISKQKNILRNRLLIIFAVLLLSSILLILFFNQQKRLKVSEAHELKSKLEHKEKVEQYEKQKRQLEKEKQKEVMDAQTRELTSYSLLVSNKNNILNQILEVNQHAINNKENTEKVLTIIKEIITRNLSVDEEWENFKMHFDKVHPHFFKKLKRLCNDLTGENLKMCAYIKIGMTNKQIAQLLQVVPTSIITNRYRLKKKLQLSDEEDLENFIRNLQ